MFAKTIEAETFSGSNVYRTKDYDKFKIHESNRPVDIMRAKKLSKRIKEKNLMVLQPIIVDSDGVIYDGQHRHYAASLVDEWVYFVQHDNLSLDDLSSLNMMAKNWGKSEWASHWSSRGKHDYTLLEEFQSGNNDLFSMSMACALCTQGTYTAGKGVFEGGNYKFNNVNHAWLVVKILRDFRPYFSSEFVNNRARAGFFWAVYNLAGNSQYSHKRMMRKLPSYRKPKIIYDKSKDVVEVLFNDIYNKGYGDAGTRLLYSSIQSDDFSYENKAGLKRKAYIPE